MKRRYADIRCYDYTSKEEFERHCKKLEAQGWHLIKDGMFQGTLDPQEMDDDTWKFTASFIKSDMI